MKQVTKLTESHLERVPLGLALGALLLFTTCAAASEEGMSLHLTRSPDGSHEIFHNDYDPYAREPAVFSIGDAESGDLLRQIHVPTEAIGRFVRSIEWLDDRYVLALGEGIYVVILDTVEGRVELSFLGSGETLTEDRDLLAFRLPLPPFYGPRPPLETDYVGIAWLMESKGGSEWRAAVLYPEVELLDLFHAKDAPSEAQRHELESPLAWSEDGQSLAFAERYDGQRWLVVLDVPGDPLQTETRRFELSDEIGTVTEVSWLPARRAVEVTGSEADTVIELSPPI